MENDQENQELALIDESLRLDLPKMGKKAEFRVLMDRPAVEIHVQELLNINPRIWKDFKERGIIKHRDTYGGYIRTVFDHYRRQNDVELIKVDENGRKSSNTECITIADKIQNIKLNRAREEDLVIKNREKRNELTDRMELERLIAPMMMSISNILKDLANTKPELQKSIDACLEQLYAVGSTMYETATGDELEDIDDILNAEMDLAELISQELEKNPIFKGLRI